MLIVQIFIRLTLFIYVFDENAEFILSNYVLRSNRPLKVTRKSNSLIMCDFGV